MADSLAETNCRALAVVGRKLRFKSPWSTVAPTKLCGNVTEISVIRQAGAICREIRSGAIVWANNRVVAQISSPHVQFLNARNRDVSWLQWSTRGFKNRVTITFFNRNRREFLKRKAVNEKKAVFRGSNFGRLLFLLLMLTGCSRLAPGNIGVLLTAPPKVCLIRGYLDWYSTGIDTLANELRAQHIAVETFREEQWGDIAAAVHAQPIILIGFSYGADDVIRIARKLNDEHLPVDLLILIDPVTPDAISANVKTCVSFYEPNGFWDIFPWLRGVPVQGGTGTAVPININIRDRKDLDEPDTSHSTIAANEHVHQTIINLVKPASKPSNH